MGRSRTAVLISGSGSNLQALLDRAAEDDAPFSIDLVISDDPGAFGLERARRAGVATEVVHRPEHPTRHGFDARIGQILADSGVRLVALAGFMRVLGAELVEAWRDRMLNIHPSLLPSFRGLHTHERALEAGVRVHGCSVHLVRPELDAGPILVQGIVPVLPNDDAAALRQRVLEVEHRCYPLALDLLAGGKVGVDGETARVDGATLVRHPLLGG